MESRRIKISVGPVRLEGELKPTKTAEEIYAALPLETTVHSWGEQFHFKVPGVRDHRETATTQVKVGDLGLWGVGGTLAIFFGRTPMSLGPDPVPVDRVNIVGRIVGDATALRQAMDASQIKVEKAS